ncbi:MAG: S24 family peptidase [Novosphingobium sp.]|uniref:S24 family peptidase n=1 Tax=Novosphingobium sp. TaxID=1874826 RepID=UPI003B990F11
MVTHDEILEELLKRLQKRGAAAAIARLLGKPDSRISELKKGGRRIQQDEMPILAEYFGMGEVAPESETNVVWVPVIGIAAAGAWREAIEVPAFLVPQIRTPNCNKAFAVQVDGDSMNLILPERSYAVIDPDQKELRHNRVYLIQNGNGEATIKRFCNEPARFEPVSDNPEHNVIHIGEHDIIVIGRVVSFTSDSGL